MLIRLTSVPIHTSLTKTNIPTYIVQVMPIRDGDYIAGVLCLDDSCGCWTGSLCMQNGDRELVIIPDDEDWMTEVKNMFEAVAVEVKFLVGERQ